ncbi:M48 family metallopeptidase [Bacteriovorax sp. Seq25_V]|uniref:M48 family metallopeptidase n=1 Tax=Bacteriovorax sp. Seq25_V TaxID=1201288 RepID=UPI00038A5333|nr:M48 family metallopeptidase [Bacteriovorax sp. Seq25_V]EQC46554.1 peptidase, M48 family [Bacteriovorax sp. Seq25_V]
MVELSSLSKIFLACICLKGLTESYLDKRNKLHILKHRNEVPEKFAANITLEDHQKAADYSVTKINVGNFFNFIGYIILIAWTLFGGLDLLNNWVLQFQLGPIATGVLFILAFVFINSIISLPQSLYTTFVIEDRFGFNKTTVKTFISDLIKGTVIGLIIGVPLLFGILNIMEKLGTYWWLYAWAFLSAFQLLLMWIYPTFIAPLFNKFTALEDGEVKDKILDLLKRTGFESNGLFVMDASKRSGHGNAYFTGFGKNKRIVFFDTLINTLDASEVEAVLAHELGHFKRKHILKMMIKAFAMSFIGFYILGALMNTQWFYEMHGVHSNANYMTLILFTLVSGVYTFFITPISAWSSRKYEFEADEFAANNSSAKDLISALVKMYKDNASTLTPDPTYSAFYHSHPPALIRVKFLETFLK